MDRSKRMVKLAYKALDDKKGEDIKILNISEVSPLADFFVIASGSNDSQVRAMVESVEEELAKEGFEVRQREGYGLGSWVLLDFGDIIVHIFDRENRSFYNLERMWRDGILTDVEQL